MDNNLALDLIPRRPGAPAGNANGVKGKMMERQLRSVLTRSDSRGLRLIVQKLVSLAIRGDLKAIEMVMDRIDGKVGQTLELRRGNDLEGMTTLELQAEIVKRAYLLTNQPVSDDLAVVHTIDPSPEPLPVPGDDTGV